MTFKESLAEVLWAIAPITLLVVILQVSFIHMPAIVLARFLVGALLVALGLFFFLQGVKIGLLPMGEMMGAELPKRAGLPVILGTAFLLGFLVTVAEPDVRVLAHQVDLVSGGQLDKNLLIFTVALGIGIFVCLAILRIVLGIPIAYLLGFGYLAVLVLSFLTPQDFVPVAFDAGGVTTGPITVPFILALGVGTASVLGERSAIADAFGLVGLASIGPVLGVMLLGVFYR